MDLHGEIVEAQKARVDLFKWKLILVAGLGAAASGVVGPKEAVTFQHPGYVLALIPLVCLYVDLLCIDQTLRIVIITKYLQLRYVMPEKRDKEDYIEYSAFVSQPTAMKPIPYSEITQRIRDEWWREISAYGLFTWAQYLSTISFAVGVVVWGRALEDLKNASELCVLVA